MLLWLKDRMIGLGEMNCLVTDTDGCAENVCRKQYERNEAMYIGAIYQPGSEPREGVDAAEYERYRCRSKALIGAEECSGAKDQCPTGGLSPDCAEYERGALSFCDNGGLNEDLARWQG